MQKKLIIIIIALLILMIVGLVIGLFMIRKNNAEKKEPESLPKYPLTLEDLYCNVKDSKKIVKVKVTLESTDQDSIKNMESKQFIIRDEINKIIRNSGESDLSGRDGQINLQNSILNALKKEFEDPSITIYFNEFILQ